MKYRLKTDRLGRPAGTIVYRAKGYDYGLASEDTRDTGIEHTSVTLDPGGGYPSFTVAWRDLEELEDEEAV